MIGKLKSAAANKEWVEILFTLLIVSFPFGSFLLSFSIGFMILYPYLVLVCILALLALWMPRNETSKLSRLYLLFLLLFFSYAFVGFFFIPAKSYALIDIRSIVLMLLTTWVFIAVRNFLGFKKWKTIILFSFKIIFVLIICFGLFEILSGWHVTGAFTEKISTRGLKDNMSYIPVFLWDNPNNFMVYVLLIGSVIILLESKSRKKNYETITILFIALMMAVVTEARIAQFTVIIISLVYGIARFTELKNSFSRKQVYFILVVLVGLIYVVGTQTFFKEIPHASATKISATEPLYPVPAGGKRLRAKVLDIYASDTILSVNHVSKDKRNSKDERLALIRNGLDFTKESHYLGIGPGQYRFRHDQNQIRHHAFGNNGAHFWLIELLSQYGILIFGIYAGILLWAIVLVTRNYGKSNELAFGILVGFLAFGCAMLLPSAFLILDIHWIFTVIWIVSAGEFYTRKSSTAEC